MSSCTFLRKKDGKFTCVKSKGKACPTGHVRSCPCISENFWNVDIYRESKPAPCPKTEIEKPVAETVLTAKTRLRQQVTKKVENHHIRKQVPVRDIEVFKKQ